MKFEYILCPIQAGTKTLKTRLIHSTSYTMNLGMGPGDRITPDEMFERATRYYTSVSDAGAALVNFSGGSFPDSDGKRNEMMSLNFTEPAIKAGFEKIIEEIHNHGTLCVSNLRLEPDEYNFCWLDDWDDLVINGDYAPHFKNKPTCPLDRLEKVINDYGQQAKLLKDMGCDGINFHMSYHSSFMCMSLSPVFNKRNDKYGGKTLKQRAGFTLDVLKRVRETCGDDFLIEIQMSAHEEIPGYTVEDWLEFCELAQGLFDIIQIRGFDGSYTHVTSFNSSKESPHTLQFAEAFKKRGLKGLTAPVGGFTDPVDIERFMAEGKTDLVTMARMWIAEPEFAKKVKEGRPEDVTPCLGCMGKCDYPSCAVNPKHGLIRNPDLFLAASAPEKVAVIGGGPAGMQAALTAAQRGHQVTLFEKSGELGGQLTFSKYPYFKWRIYEYLKWLIRQTEKSGIDIQLNTQATPGLLKDGGYDAIICALGSAPKSPPVSGVDKAEVWQIDDVWGREEELGHRVVVVGGGSSGRETALYLANCGHEVTMLTRSQQIYTDNCHCIWGQVEQYINEKNLTVINYATTIKIGSNYVVCEIKDKPLRSLDYFYVHDRLEAEKQAAPDPIPGFLYPEYPNDQPDFLRPPEEPKPEPEYPVEVRRIECDSIVVTGGRTPRTDEAASFSGLAPKIYVVGDNAVPASIQEATLNGFAAAMNL